ncbi:hypothetical protein MGSAQ_001697, partial [marine sediment metagenome]
MVLLPTRLFRTIWFNKLSTATIYLTTRINFGF